MIQINAIILNYNSASESIRLYNDLKMFGLNNLKIIVADNFSIEQDRDDLENSINEGELIFFDENFGYAKANRLAIEIAKSDGAEIIFLLNPDIIIEKNVFLRLSHHLIVNKNISVVGPRICDHENPDQIYSDGGMVIEEKGFFTDHLNSNRLNHDVANPGLHEVDYVNGSCLVFKSNLIDKIPFMREEFFLYFEETEWCLRLRDNGFKCMVDSSLTVLHKASSKNISYNYYMTRNRIWLSRLRNRYVVRTIKEILKPLLEPFFQSILKFERPNPIIRIKLRAVLDSLKPIRL